MRVQQIAVSLYLDKLRIKPPTSSIWTVGFLFASTATDRHLQTMTTLAAHEPAAASIPHLSHLQLLEAESIQIFREVASEFQNPVMLYSIGKDSSVMLRLAQKAFFPGPIPFPLLHIDTGYKFRRDDHLPR